MRSFLNKKGKFKSFTYSTAIEIELINGLKFLRNCVITTAKNTVTKFAYFIRGVIRFADRHFHPYMSSRVIYIRAFNLPILDIALGRYFDSLQLKPGG
jgi:hypothetical protein